MVRAGSVVPPPSIQSDEFNGPLDLLLEEVRLQNVAIDQLEMAPITARFLEYVRSANQQNLNLNIEWLHMAATLIQWKSQALLPVAPTGAPADPIRDELVRQLLAHKKQLAEDLDRRRSSVQASFSRPAATPATMAELVDPGTVSVWDMIQQARELATWVTRHRQQAGPAELPLLVKPDDVTVSQMMDYLQERLVSTGGSRLDGLQLLGEQTSVDHRSCLFLAMLEMAREQRIEIAQNVSFGPISLAGIRQVNNF